MKHLTPIELDDDMIIDGMTVAEIDKLSEKEFQAKKKAVNQRFLNGFTLLLTTPEIKWRRTAYGIACDGPDGGVIEFYTAKGFTRFGLIRPGRSEFSLTEKLRFWRLVKRIEARLPS